MRKKKKKEDENGEKKKLEEVERGRGRERRIGGGGMRGREPKSGERGGLVGWGLAIGNRWREKLGVGKLGVLKKIKINK